MPNNIKNADDIQKFLDIISNSKQFIQKFGQSWILKHERKIENIKKKALSSPNPVKFLTTLIKAYDPNYKIWKPNTKVGAGKIYNFPSPNIGLGSNAANYLPNTENQSKAKELQDKIAAHNAEIEKLRLAQEKIQKAADLAREQHEKLNPIFDEKTLKYFAYIDKHCSEYITAVRETNKILFRGQDDTSMPIFIGHPRKNRSPKDSSVDAQKLYDKNLSIMGFKALRSNSIFTSSSQAQASAFGSVYAIFPLNGFHFTWSTKESDLVLHSVSDITGEDDESDAEELYFKYTDIVDNLNYALDDFVHYTPEYKDSNKSPEYKALNKKISEFEKINPYTTTTKIINSALVNMITAYLTFCVKYPKFKNYGNTVYLSMKKFLEDAKQGIKEPEAKKDKAGAAKMIKDFGLRQDSLNAALKSGNEVCILGDYIAVSYRKYEKQIKEYFLTKPKIKKPLPIKKTIKPTKKKI